MGSRPASTHCLASGGSWVVAVLGSVGTKSNFPIPLAAPRVSVLALRKGVSSLSKIKRLAPAFALALATSVLWVSHVPASLAQQGRADRYGSRKPACGCFCGGTTPDYVLFGDEDCAGILTADVCGENLANLPPEEREGVCQKVKAQRKLDSCPVFAPYCEPEAERAPELPPNPDRDGVADGSCNDAHR